MLARLGAGYRLARAGSAAWRSRSRALLMPVGILGELLSGPASPVFVLAPRQPGP
ncbi:MAG: hypothetical protein IPN17_10765 [Deltaproteobacteria bacterium]|nr:hypothetical protein [Deltaproteobacteria bacterium]